MSIKQKTVRAIVSSILLAILFPVIAVVSQILFYLAAPSSFWFEYYSVEPLSRELSSQSSLRFESTFIVNRTSDFSWNDILQCEHKDGIIEYFSNYNSARINSEAGERTTQWVYHGVLPTPPRKCMLESNITVHLPYGIEKHQTIHSSFFFINE